MIIRIAGCCMLFAALLSAHVALAVEPSDSSASAYPLVKGEVGIPDRDSGRWLDDLDPFRTQLEESESAWEAPLRALAGVIRQSQPLAVLRGYYPKTNLFVRSDEQPVPQVELEFEFYWEGEDAEADSGSLQHGESLSLRINRLPEALHGDLSAFNSPEWMNDEQGRFFPLPRPERTIDGFPVYGGQLLVTTGKRVLMLPVSRERALKAMLRAMQGELQNVDDTQGMYNQELIKFNSPEMKKSRQQTIDQVASYEPTPEKAAAARARMEEVYRVQEQQLREAAERQWSDNPAIREVQANVAALQARIDAMSPAERQAPAYVSREPEKNLPLGVDIVAAGMEGALALMAFNPEFFDTKQPQAIQLVTTEVETLQSLQEAGRSVQELSPQERLPLAIVEQADWRRIAGLMK